MDFNVIFQNSIDAIITTSNTGEITSFNPAAELLFEYSQDEAIGQPIDILYSNKADIENVIKSLENTTKFKGEIQNITKSGDTIYCFLSANELKDEQGNVIGSMGISRDITSQKKMQEKYEKLVKGVSEIIYSTDVNGNYDFVNDAVFSIMGFRPEELIGESFKSMNMVHPDDIHRIDRHYDLHFKSRLNQSYIEFRAKKKDGSYIWVGQQVTTNFNSKGLIIGFYGVVRDINDQKQSEILLKISESKYKEILNNSTELIQSLDQNGKFLMVNDQWKKTLEYTEKELNQLDIYSIIHEDSIEHCKNLFKELLSKGESVEERVFYALKSKSGKKIEVDGVISVKILEKDITSIQAYLRDITEQKITAKKLQEKENTLQQITDTLSDVFYLYNVDHQRYDYVSSNCIEILGKDQDFFYNSNDYVADLVHDDDRINVYQSRKEVLNGHYSDVDYRIDIEGTIRWINEKSFPIIKNGKVKAISGVCRNINDIKKAYETIYNQNLQIGSSMLYAKRLQEAVLTTEESAKAIFEDSFVIFKPKDIVSGDFYVVEHIKTNDGHYLPALFVGDCTGHGVPGAVLSLTCNMLVRESFTNWEVNTPGQALDFVSDRLSSFFNSASNKVIRDGMDASFCVLDEEHNTLYFSGAYSSCFILRKEKMIEIKGDRKHVGFNENASNFTTHSVKVENADRIFLFSDGIVDQFGGPNGKKFTKKRFFDLIIKHKNLNMNQLGNLLHDSIMDWKGTEEQTDDITCIGVELHLRD